MDLGEIIENQAKQILDEGFRMEGYSAGRQALTDAITKRLVAVMETEEMRAKVTEFSLASLDAAIARARWLMDNPDKARGH